MNDDFRKGERSRYSQNGEDGVIERLVQLAGTETRYFVEFAAGPDGAERNTRLLEQRGWRGLLLDCRAPVDHPSVRREFVTAENINALFHKYKVPHNLDLLSIDIDGNDYWVWNALDGRFRPRLVIVEYNAYLPPSESKSIAYDPQFRFPRTRYFGASLLALARLAKRKGYTLVYCESAGVNAFFVREDLWPQLTDSVEEAVARLYRAPNSKRSYLWGLIRLSAGEWPVDRERRMIDVEAA